MFIKEIILEGFKSYPNRTVISGFDPAFNAITGLNGSGKSNILDAICFVLGISNLTQVRVGNLQELVYKNGQGGVSKATVSLVFDNSDSSNSPIGFEEMSEITVSRQVVIGGRNKYLINGVNAQLQRVQNLFHSVQLNVNNPHFLIMQGRITKVLNMKAPEILAMVEEAAGTRMFEIKKDNALKVIEKKEAKVDEINKVLVEEITPTLEKLRKDKAGYMQWSANNVETERLARFCTAADYLAALSTLSASDEKKAEMIAQKTAMEQEKKETEVSVEIMKGEIEMVNSEREHLAQSEFKSKEEEAAALSKEVVQKSSVHDHRKETLASENKSLTVLNKALDEAREALAKKTAEIQKLSGDAGAQVREEHAKLSASLVQLQREYEAMCTGVSADGDSGSSLADQLMQWKKKATAMITEAKQSEIKIKHLESQRAELSKAAAAAEKGSKKSVQERESLVAQKTKLTTELSQISFDATEDARNKEELRAAEQDRLAKNEIVDALSAKLAALDFTYTDPEKKFDRSRVKGLVANLINVTDPKYETAIEVTAGAKLYNVVVDTEETGKALLSKGQLKKRVTIIPLNRITSKGVSEAQVAAAQSVGGGKDNVNVALEFVGFPNEIDAAMDFVFGGTLVCSDSATANAVAFHKDVKVKAVTLEGDMFDPAGTLTGGSKPQGGSVLSKLRELSEARAALQECDNKIARLRGALNQANVNRDKHTKLARELELKTHELNLLEDRLKGDADHQVIAQLKTTEETIATLKVAIVKAKEEEKAADARCTELTAQMKDMGSHRETKLKESEQKIKGVKERIAAIEAQAKNGAQLLETRKLEVAELNKEIASLEAQIKQAQAQIATLEGEVAALAEDVAASRRKYEAAKQVVDEHRAAIVGADKKVAKLIKQRDAAIAKAQNMELEIKKHAHSVERFSKEIEESRRAVERMESKYPWIATEKHLFGQAGTDYDFKARAPAAARKRLDQIVEQQEKLAKSINKKVMGMFEKAEQEYQDLMSKKRIIEGDKAKITAVIDELETKKKEALQAAWEKVNKDFGSIYATLLPGTMAKLDPPEGQTIFDGLEIKVAFGGKWKDGLSELSGGQKSLCALSLILSLLLFKPAPMYILDEIDAALDLSHTQNIGRMLKNHFSQSQFIVVSLKEGMFQNANVLFKTKFVDGASTVTRMLGGSNVPSKENDAEPAAAKKGKGAASGSTAGGKGVLSSKN